MRLDGSKKDWSGNPFTADQAVLFIEEGQVVRSCSFIEAEEGIHAIEDRLLGDGIGALLHLSLLAAYQLADDEPEIRVKLLVCLQLLHEEVPKKKGKVETDASSLPF